MPLRELNSDVPEDLESVIMRCLNKSPEERYQTVDELEESLAACDTAGEWTQGKAWEVFAKPQLAKPVETVDYNLETQVVFNSAPAV